MAIATDRSVWISASFFCSKANWHQLLKNGIESFLNQVAPDAFYSVYLALNHTSGDNIRMALLTQKKMSLTLSKRIDTHFVAFFEEAKFKKNEITLPIRSLFLPFPESTVQYGLFSVSPDPETFHLSQEISNLILTILAENPFDEEDVITLGLYLHLIWLRQSTLLFPHYFENFIRIYTEANIQEENDPTFVIEAISKYDSNKRILYEIYKEVNSDVREGENLFLTRLKSWESLCAEKANQKTVTSDASNVTSELSKITDLINRHLGISKNRKELLYYFIKQLLFNS